MPSALGMATRKSSSSIPKRAWTICVACTETDGGKTEEQVGERSRSLQETIDLVESDLTDEEPECVPAPIPFLLTWLTMLRSEPKTADPEIEAETADTSQPASTAPTGDSREDVSMLDVQKPQAT